MIMFCCLNFLNSLALRGTFITLLSKKEGPIESGQFQGLRSCFEFLHSVLGSFPRICNVSVSEKLLHNTDSLSWSPGGNQLWRPVGKEWAVDRLPVLQAPNVSALYCGVCWSEGAPAALVGKKVWG